MKENTTFLAWIALGGTLALAIGVAFFARSLQGQIADYAQARTRGDMARNQDSSLIRAHELAQVTASQRASLEGVLHTDVLSIATMLTSAGTEGGVDLQVSNALSEPAPILKGSTFSLQAIGFTVQGDGTFGKLMAAAALLEALPIAGSIEHFDMTHTSADVSGRSGLSWHMDMRIRVLTTAQNSP